MSIEIRDGDGRVLETTLSARTLSVDLETPEHTRIVAIAGGLQKLASIRAVANNPDDYVLLPETIEEAGTGEASVDDPVSRHPYSQESLKIIEEHRGEWVLDLGAGGTLQRWDNVVQIDIFRYPMTDVVGSADRLPFRDNSFGAVISQAVFEPPIGAGSATTTGSAGASKTRLPALLFPIATASSIVQATPAARAQPPMTARPF